MAENMVVPGWSSITADQMSEFWKKASPKRKQIGLSNFQNFLDNPNRFSDETSKFISLSQAKKILGHRKVIGVTNFNKVWKTGHKEAPIFYTEENLFDASFFNVNRGDDWRLVYYGGQSIRELYEIIGTDKKHQPHFEIMEWYLMKKEDFWADKVPPAGYYLINFKGLFLELDYQQQELKMAFKFGKDFERTDPHVLSETFITILELTGKRVVENWYHRSDALSDSGHHVYVGCFFDPSGWVVSNHWGDDYKGILCVSLSRKWNIDLIVGKQDITKEK